MILLLNGCANLMAEPSCPLKPLKTAVSKPAVQTSFLAETIYFLDGDASITQSDEMKIKEVAERARELRADVRVLGHASSRTNHSSPVERILTNFNISHQRAAVVADTLKQYGVPVKTITYEALSDNRPAEIEVNKEAEAANRRVEIFLYF